jgi:hypothetical protein
MKKKILIVSLLMSILTYAHSSKTSMLLISKIDKGRYVMQINCSITAFEGEIDYNFPKDVYKNPEEFKKLVIKHFQKNFLFVLNQKDTIKLINPIVVLGHETKFVAELKGITENPNDILIKNTVFKDFINSKAAVIMDLKGFPKKQYVLNNENNHTLNLKLDNENWIVVDSSRFKPLYLLLLLLLPIAYFYIKLRKKKETTSQTI